MNAKRILWIVPNAFLHVVWIAVAIFVLINLRDIQAIGLLPFWATIMTLLFFVNILGTYRIFGWIKEGKL